MQKSSGKKVRMRPGRPRKGKAPADIEPVIEPAILEGIDPDIFADVEVKPTTVRPVVEKLAINPRIIFATIGEHKGVLVMVRPNNKFYIPGMEIPLDVSLEDFDRNKLVIFNGDPPRRKGQW